MSNRSHITIFLPGLNVGGAERVLLRLAEEFAIRGLRCDIVTAQSGGVWSTFDIEGVRLVELGHTRPIRAVFSFWRYLRKTRPSTVISSVTNANIASLIACNMPGVKVRQVVREANFLMLDMSGGSRIGNFLTSLALRVLYSRADRIIALTPGMKLHLMDSLGLESKLISVIPNPLLTPIFDRDHQQAESPLQANLVVACGRLTEQKDFPNLLRAISLVSKEIAVKLILIGDGPLKYDLRSLSDGLGLTDCVEFVGHSPDPSIWLKRANAFVLSSRWEGFPNVLLEAIACGCPIVSTNCSDAVVELLEGGRLGRIVETGRPDLLAEAVLETLRRPIYIECVSEHLSKYSVESVAGSYIDVLTGVDSDLKEAE